MPRSDLVSEREGDGRSARSDGGDEAAAGRTFTLPVLTGMRQGQQQEEAAPPHMSERRGPVARSWPSLNWGITNINMMDEKIVRLFR